MASVRLKAGSKYFWACITLPDGRRKQFSTRTENERDALEVATRAENAIRRNKSRAGLSEALERIAEDIHGARTVAAVEWLESWVTRKAREVSAKSAGRYKSIMLEVLDRIAVKRLDEITVAHVQRMLDHWCAVHSATNANFKLKIVRVALNEAWRDGLVPENVAAKVRAVKTRKGSPRRPFTEGEIATLLASCDAEWRAVVLMALYTGQRLNDVAVMRWQDIEGGVLRIVTAKTDRPMTIPIMPAVIDALPERQSEALFPRLAMLSPMARSHAFRGVLERAGLVSERPTWTGPVGDGRKVLRNVSDLTFHCLRHTTNSWLKRAGIADGIVMAIVGHDSKAMSAHYTHIDVETMRLALGKLPKL